MVNYKRTFVLLLAVCLGFLVISMLYFSTFRQNYNAFPKPRRSQERSVIYDIQVQTTSTPTYQNSELPLIFNNSKILTNIQNIVNGTTGHLTTSTMEEKSTTDDPFVPLRGAGDSTLPFGDKNFTLGYNIPYDLLKGNTKENKTIDNDNRTLKRILLWNEVDGDLHYGLGFGHEPFIRAGCRVNTCTITANRSEFPLEQVDAIVWHFRSRDRSLPPKRYPQTNYVFWNMESGSYTFGDLRVYKNIFNWSFTYRLDSDFANPYGAVYRRRDPLPEQNYSNITAQKTKFAAWFVSHCNVVSGRQDFVKTLKQWIAIDIYGGCGATLKCDRQKQWESCYTVLERDYKFYFSFENSLCKDYVTEKFFNVLKLNVIPVVYGLADYHLQAPHRSYINAFDYGSAKELADYLLYLNTNITAYNEYFQWKRYYYVEINWYNQFPYDWDLAAKPWCQLCERLHMNNIKKLLNLYQWYVEDAHCITSKDKKISKLISG